MAPAWEKHPHGRSARPPFVALSSADLGARVLGVGARCDLGARGVDGQAFLISEFVALSTDRWVTLHKDRGVTLSALRGAKARAATADEVISAVLGAVLPDDDNGEAHSWEYLAELAKGRGLSVTAAELMTLPYDVVLSGAVINWLEAP